MITNIVEVEDKTKGWHNELFKTKNAKRWLLETWTNGVDDKIGLTNILEEELLNKTGLSIKSLLTSEKQEKTPKMSYKDALKTKRARKIGKNDLKNQTKTTPKSKTNKSKTQNEKKPKVSKELTTKTSKDKDDDGFMRVNGAQKKVRINEIPEIMTMNRFHALQVKEENQNNGMESPNFDRNQKSKNAKTYNGPCKNENCISVMTNGKTFLICSKNENDHKNDHNDNDINNEFTLPYCDDSVFSIIRKRKFDGNNDKEEKKQKRMGDSANDDFVMETDDPTDTLETMERKLQRLATEIKDIKDKKEKIQKEILDKEAERNALRNQRLHLQDDAGCITVNKKSNDHTEINEANQKQAGDGDDSQKQAGDENESQNANEPVPKSKQKKTKMFKPQLLCAQCTAHDCPSLFEPPLVTSIIQENKCKNIEKFHNKDNPVLKNLLETDKWIISETNNEVRHQPVVDVPPEKGKKFNVIGIAYGNKTSTVISITVDSGSFVSAMHKTMADEIGLKPYKVEHKRARTASGYISFNKAVKCKVDFGVIQVSMEWAIVEDEGWPKNLILLGTDMLESIDATLDFRRSTMFIKNTFPVRMFTNKVQKNEYMEQMKNAYITFKSIDVRASERIELKPNCQKKIYVMMEKWDAMSLQNSNVYFCGNDKNKQITIQDMWIGSNFEWLQRPLEIYITNTTNRLIYLPEGNIIGSLKPLVSEKLQKNMSMIGLNDEVQSLPNFDDSNDEHNGINDILDPWDDDEIVWMQDGTTDLDVKDGIMVMEQENDGFSSKPSIKPFSEDVEKVLKNAEIEVEKFERSLGREYKPDFHQPSKEMSEEELYDKLKLPEYLRRQWNIVQEEDKRSVGISKITIRKDGSPEEIEQMIEESVKYRNDYWLDKGKEHLISLFTIGSEFSPEQRKRVEDIIWKYRTAFGVTTRAISGGIRHFGITIERNGAEMEVARPRGASRFSKMLFRKYIDLFLECNLARKTMGTAHSHAFLVEKPKVPSTVPRMKTVEDLQNPNLTEEDMTKRYRFVVDLSKVSKACQEYSFPCPTPREMLNMFKKGDFILTMDMAIWFPQVKVDKKTSEELFSFVGPERGEQYSLTSCAMGHKSSMALCSQILGLIFFDIMKKVHGINYADNVAMTLPSIDELIDTFEAMLIRAVEFNVVIKPSEVSIGIATDSKTEGPIEILGFEIANSKIHIPTRRKMDYCNDELPTTKKALDKLIGRLSFFSAFSPQFAEVMKHYRDEMKPLKALKKFEMTPKLRKIVKYMMELFVQSPGIHLLSEENWNKLPLVLFTDASKSAYGGTLLALDGDKLIPLFATSKSWNKPMRRACSNKRELAAIYYSMLDFEQAILSRKVLIMTDNSFAKMTLQREIEDVAPKLKTMVLTLRERYDYRCFHIAGKDNTIADLLSRYCLPGEARKPPSFDDADFKKVSAHMKETKLRPDFAQEIKEQFQDFVEQNRWNKEDAITQEVQSSMPSCYVVNGEMEFPHCEMGEICCLEDEIYGMNDSKIWNLTTIHEVTPKLIEEMEEQLTGEQKQRLKDAKYVLKSDEINNAANKIEHIKISSSNDAEVSDQWGPEEEERLQRLLECVNNNQPKEYTNTASIESDNLINKENSSLINKSALSSNEKPVTAASSKVDNTDANEAANSDNIGIRTSTKKRKEREEENQKVTKKRKEIMKVDERNHCLMAIMREEDKGNEDDIGLNEYVIREDGVMEIRRDFSMEQVDSLNHIIAQISHLIPEDQDGEISDEEDVGNEWCMEGEKPEDLPSPLDSDDVMNIINEVNPMTWDNLCDSSEDENDIMVVTRKQAKEIKTKQLKQNERTKAATKPKEKDMDGMNEEAKIKKAQKLDDDTQMFVELVRMKKKPLDHEIRTETEYCIALNKIFETLEVESDGTLIKKAMDANGEMVNLIVVPEEMAYGLARRMHETYCHINCWKLEKILMRNFFIYNIRAVTRKVMQLCEKCLLSQSPKMNTKRKMKVFSRQPGKYISMDTLEMPNAGRYRYILVCICQATGYILAKKMKGKSAQDVAAAIESIITSNNITFARSSSDEGTEFKNEQVLAVLHKYGCKHTFLHRAHKGGVTAEIGNAKILSLLRKHLDHEKDWPKEYRKVIFALNNTSMKYGNVVETPNYLFNARNINGVEWMDEDEQKALIKREESIRKIMTEISNERKLETKSLLANVMDRDEGYRIGDKVLVWNEWVVKRKLTGAGAKMKLKSFWGFAEVIDKKLDNYIVRMDGDMITRRVHRRQMRPIPPSHMKEKS